MKIAGDRIQSRTILRLRYGSYQGDEVKYLEPGAYVKIIDPYYLPRGFDIPFSRATEDVVYTQYGFGIIPKGATEPER